MNYKIIMERERSKLVQSLLKEQFRRKLSLQEIKDYDFPRYKCPKDLDLERARVEKEFRELIEKYK